MQMTHAEIRRMYRESKNKKAQLKILAELNACGVEEIKEILREKPRLKAESIDITEIVEPKIENSLKVPRETDNAKNESAKNKAFSESKIVKVAKLPREEGYAKNESIENKGLERCENAEMPIFTSRVKDALLEKLDQLEEKIKLYDHVMNMAAADKKEAEDQYKDIAEFLKGAKIC